MICLFYKSVIFLMWVNSLYEGTFRFRHSLTLVGRSCLRRVSSQRIMYLFRYRGRTYCMRDTEVDGDERNLRTKRSSCTQKKSGPDTILIFFFFLYKIETGTKDRVPKLLRTVKDSLSSRKQWALFGNSGLIYTQIRLLHWVTKNLWKFPSEPVQSF